MQYKQFKEKLKLFCKRNMRMRKIFKGRYTYTSFHIDFFAEFSRNIRRPSVGFLFPSKFFSLFSKLEPF